MSYTLNINESENKTLRSAAAAVRQGKLKEVSETNAHYFENFMEVATPKGEFEASTPECRGTVSVLMHFARRVKGKKAEAAKSLAAYLRS